MAPQVDYFLDDEDIKGANESGKFLFTVPDDAVARGKRDPSAGEQPDPKFKATWTQSLEVTESKVYEDVSKDRNGNEYSATVFEVAFQVPSNSIRVINGEPQADPNAGKSHRAWYRLVPAAKGNKAHPKFKANNFNLARLLGILRSAWGTNVIPHGTRPNLGEYFSGETPAVVGAAVVSTMKQFRNDYDGELKDELTDFVALELQGV
jgi:hypothetical protein